MDHCVHQVLIFSIRLVVCIQLACRIECFFGLSGLSQGEISLKQPFINSGKCCIKPDTSLAVFDSLAEHLEINVAHGAIGQDLHARLDVARLGVELDGPPVILPPECLVTFDFFSFGLGVGCSFYHYFVFWLLKKFLFNSSIL